MPNLIPQFSFQNGELSISTPTKSYGIRGWPEPRPREKLGDGDWKNCRPEFRLVKPQPEVSTPASGVITPGEDDCGPELVSRTPPPMSGRKAGAENNLVRSFRYRRFGSASTGPSRT
jgi:hypothetical protein